MNRKSYIVSFLLVVLLCTTPFIAYAQESSCSVNLEVEKTISGDTPSTDESFVFVLNAVDDEPMPSENSITIVGKGTKTFESIEYTTVGDYHYTLSEVKGNAVGYTYDSTVYSITVQVTTDDNRNLYAAVYMAKEGSDGKSSKAIFTNNYKAPQPAKSHTPETSVSSKNNLGTADTGDNTNLSLWLALSAFGLIGLVITLFVTSKDKNTEK